MRNILVSERFGILVQEMRRVDSLAHRDLIHAVEIYLGQTSRARFRQRQAEAFSDEFAPEFSEGCITVLSSSTIGDHKSKFFSTAALDFRSL
jgi:hypothetical protein